MLSYGNNFFFQFHVTLSKVLEKDPPRRKQKAMWLICNFQDLVFNENMFFFCIFLLYAKMYSNHNESLARTLNALSTYIEPKMNISIQCPNV